MTNVATVIESEDKKKIYNVREPLKQFVDLKNNSTNNRLSDIVERLNRAKITIRKNI